MDGVRAGRKAGHAEASTCIGDGERRPLVGRLGTAAAPCDVHAGALVRQVLRIDDHALEHQASIEAEFERHGRLRADVDERSAGYHVSSGACVHAPHARRQALGLEDALRVRRRGVNAARAVELLQQHDRRAGDRLAAGLVQQGPAQAAGALEDEGERLSRAVAVGGDDRLRGQDALGGAHVEGAPRGDVVEPPPAPVVGERLGEDLLALDRLHGRPRILHRVLDPHPCPGDRLRGGVDDPALQAHGLRKLEVEFPLAGCRHLRCRTCRRETQARGDDLEVYEPRRQVIEAVASLGVRAHGLQRHVRRIDRALECRQLDVGSRRAVLTADHTEERAALADHHLECGGLGHPATKRGYEGRGHAIAREQDGGEAVRADV